MDLINLDFYLSLEGIEFQKSDTADNSIPCQPEKVTNRSRQVLTECQA